jgi:hypothetical protein
MVLAVELRNCGCAASPAGTGESGFAWFSSLNQVAFQLMVLGVATFDTAFFGRSNLSARMRQEVKRQPGVLKITI